MSLVFGWLGRMGAVGKIKKIIVAAGRSFAKTDYVPTLAL